MDIKRLNEEERAWVKAIVQEVMEVHMLSCPYGKEISKIKWMMAGALLVGGLVGVVSRDVGTVIRGLLGLGA